jgi:hypothetical protein
VQFAAVGGLPQGTYPGPQKCLDKALTGNR